MNGQLGTGSKFDSNLPKYLRIPYYTNNMFKVASVQAGFYSTHLLIEDQNVFFSGMNTMTCSDETLFKILDWKARLFKSKGELPFAPIKLYTKWSKSLQVTYMVFVDYRGSDMSAKEKEEFAKKLNETWEIDYDQTIPFIDSE